jgi:hypothetical protein
MANEAKKRPAFLKTVYLSNREIRLILAGLYSLKMTEEEINASAWKKFCLRSSIKNRAEKRLTRRSSLWYHRQYE